MLTCRRCGHGNNEDAFLDLVKELQRNGLSFDVRKLNVGDFLRVAREKVAPIAGQLQSPVGRELVLDYIIEKKRMDDLCGSIIDGRFREQKNCRLTCRSRELEGDGEDEEEEEERGTPSCSLISCRVQPRCNQKQVSDSERSVRPAADAGERIVRRQSSCYTGALSTPLSLLTAYERCAGEAEKEKLLSSIRYGKLKSSPKNFNQKAIPCS
ncbi:hypothetical protein NQZ68_016270 [Dissostichus eleginoides]|nr:hypothetical protein NQZ68_016270 [Dissostichus eleginoides]